MRAGSAARSVFAPLLVALAAGCASMLEGDEVHRAPLFERERPVPSAPWTADVGVPFGHAEGSTGRTSSGLRPLWRRVDTDAADRLDILFPLYREHREEHAFASRLFPLWFRDELDTPDGRDVDNAVMPFLWWGDEPGQGSYFLFLPFYGTVKQKFLMDEGTFVLFPLYLRSRNGEYAGHHVLWPLGHSGSGGGKSAFRVLPFWSQSDKEGVYRRRAVAWPIVHWGEENLDTDDPHHRWLVWPLIGRETSELTSSTTLLWPFFQWSDGPKSTARDLPFPFHRHRSVRNDAGEVESELFWLWPWYGTARAPSEESAFYLWPFVNTDRSEDADVVRTGTWVNPFWVRRRVTPKNGDRGSTSWRLWPLASGEDRADGTSEWSTLAPIPFAKWESFDANWGVFFELLRRRRDPDGSTATDALFSLVRHRSGPDGARFRVPGVISTESDGARSEWNLVEGLLGGRADPGEGSSLRLLWFLRIPLSSPTPGGARK